MARLGINIKQIALLRQASGTNEPDPVTSAVYAELGGADGIVCPIRDELQPVTERDVQLLKELVKISDIFIQNFRPGTIGEMGFSYEVLHDLNPRIIMLNVSAYGQYGPYRERIGFDSIGQAISGFMSVTGYAENPPTGNRELISKLRTQGWLTLGVGPLKTLTDKFFWIGPGKKYMLAAADLDPASTKMLKLLYKIGEQAQKRAGATAAAATLELTEE